MNKTTVITVVVVFVALFITYSLGYRLGSKRSSDDCREIASDLIEQVLTKNGCTVTREFEKKCPLPTTLVYTNCPTSRCTDKFDYMVYLSQHSKHPIVRTISMLVPDLYYRTILSVRINGDTYNKLDLDADFNSVTNISIVSGSDTCLVYQRPRLLQNYNKSATSMLFRDEDARRLFKRCHVWERMLDIATILPDVFDRNINAVRIDNVLLGDFNLSTEFKSINHIEVLEDGNWVTVYKRPDTIILHHQ